MLKSTSSSVLHIASEVGYESEPSFNRAFKREFGLLDSQVKPYTFNPQPFIVDLNSAMQGYLT